MACCYTAECGEYAVTPMLIAPCLSSKCCEDPPICYPCLPRCPKTPQVVYCCEKRPSRPRTPPRRCCEEKREKTPPPPKSHRCPPPRECVSCTAPPSHCPTCCSPIKTKYVIPCYRYEDGRIERYVPTIHGRLPRTAYQRNGIQDQMHGYRGAVRYLCAVQGPRSCCVHTAVEPLRTVFSKVTKEVLPIKKKKEKKCP